jgi:uncharacterized oligopeptide transporter (OPT) family protein
LVFPLCLSIVLQGNGVIVGLGICGVVINATSSAATLMGDFRTGYICLAAPRAMFGAQLVGQLLGALITPMAFMLFYRTGQVRLGADVRNSSVQKSSVQSR